jgi:glucan phosphoethanolaminetransferase (alkaline phosphatase superfamily)
LTEYEKTGAPLFLFGITMENHQQYSDKYKSFDVSVKNPHLNERDLNNLQNYTQGVKNADAALARLIEFIDGRARPTVIAYFGDHLPSITDMGTLAAYVDSGFVEPPTYSTEARKKLYATPFVIYANYPLDKEAAAIFLSSERYVASYDLLNLLSGFTGSGKSRYMAYLDKLRDALPYYNKRLEIRNLTEEQSEMLKIQYFATYNAIKK